MSKSTRREPKAQATGTVPHINGDRFYAPEPTPAPVTESIIGADVRKQEAQAYALRVWAGQSESLKRSERVARVMRALEGQSYSTDGIKLPGAEVDDDDWTDEDEAPVVLSFRRSDEGIV